MSESFPSSNHLESLGSAEQTPAERFRVDPTKYPLFSTQFEHDARETSNASHHWNIDKTLSTYLTNTAKLIATIDGSSTEYEDNPALNPPNHIIYLDKSARPVSWLVNIFWSDLSEAKRPTHSYLNIDRIPWFHRSGAPVIPGGYIQNPDGSKRVATPQDFHIENISPTDIARIRALYLPGGIISEDPDAIMHTPSSLDGKNLLIIDEVARSGSTLTIAKQLLHAAFPELGSVQGAYFWESGSKIVGDEHQMLSVPVWYNAQNAYGRGIGDVDTHAFAERYAAAPNAKTRAQKFGSIVLSSFTNLNTEPGQLSRELAQEIKQMHADFESGHILFRPPRNYDDDRQDAVVEAQGLQLLPPTNPSPDSYINVVKAINQRPAAI